MIHHFAGFELDTDKEEVRRDGMPCPVEPQVFAVLRLLVENRDRLVGKDEIIEKIWQGRIVSDAAIASRIKSARQAIGDDGRAQGFIRTVHRRGFRFVAEPAADTEKAVAGRPAIAVLPFERLDGGDQYPAIGDALAHEVILALSRLRWLFVIARGTSFQFRRASPGEVRSALHVGYCLNGTVELHNDKITVGVELSDPADAVIWSERFAGRTETVHEMRESIARSVVNALELQIPLHEISRTANKTPDSLDAWSAYHLGLHHMYRFDRDGNARAAHLFERAIGLDPGFARAHAGLSFTHFEDAFLRFADDRAAAAALARRHAEKGLENDPLDPFCNLVMGRVWWLEGDLEASLPWLDRAIALNPNYAQAKYSRGWTQSLLGDGSNALTDADAARALSPLDPLLYGMLGVRSLSHMVRDEPAEAALWGERAARAPRAHALIEMIAATGHALNGDDEKAKAWLASALRRHPGLDAEVFLKTFPFRDDGVRRRIRAALTRLA